MGIELIEKRFALMGARVRISEETRRNRAGIDIREDMEGEFFDIRIGENEKVEYEVVDLQAKMRHLLLLARRENRKEKFLCGHDERHWFVCAVPGNGINNVVSAMEALQPLSVRWQARHKVKRAKNRFARRNEAFVRQGEWFFVPVDQLKVKETLIFRNEPISRGNGSKPHFCEEVYRDGGVEVMVCSHYPRGVTLNAFNHFLKSNAEARKWDWKLMRQNAAVYVRGRVRHPDHKTIVLDGWHRVLMNRENEAPGMRSVVFLD